MIAPTYQPRDPSATVLYQMVVQHLETFLVGTMPIRLKLAAAPPPLALVRLEPGQCAWASVGPLVRTGGEPIRVKLSAGRYRNINRFSWLIQALAQGLGTRAPLSTSLRRQTLAYFPSH
jgi:hypothetical protein